MDNYGRLVKPKCHYFFMYDALTKLKLHASSALHMAVHFHCISFSWVYLQPTKIVLHLAQCLSAKYIFTFFCFHCGSHRQHFHSLNFPCYSIFFVYWFLEEYHVCVLRNWYCMQFHFNNITAPVTSIEVDYGIFMEFHCPYFSSCSSCTATVLSKLH